MATRRTTGIVLLVLLLALAFAVARNSWAAGITGRVQEIMRNDSAAMRTAPRPRAQVLVVWHGDLLDILADSRSICLRAVRVVSGADGSFSQPGWWRGLTWPPITNLRVAAYV